MILHRAAFVIQYFWRYRVVHEFTFGCTDGLVIRHMLFLWLLHRQNFVQMDSLWSKYWPYSCVLFQFRWPFPPHVDLVLVDRIKRFGFRNSTSSCPITRMLSPSISQVTSATQMLKVQSTELFSSVVSEISAHIADARQPDAILPLPCFQQTWFQFLIFSTPSFPSYGWKRRCAR